MDFRRLDNSSANSKIPNFANCMSTLMKIYFNTFTYEARSFLSFVRQKKEKQIPNQRIIHAYITTYYVFMLSLDWVLTFK